MRSRGELGGTVAFDQVHLPILLIPMGPFYIGWVLASGALVPEGLDFLLALLSVFPFLSLGTVLINDAFDVDVDAKSRRKGRFASSTGRVDAARLVAAAGACLAIALVLSMLVSLEFGLTVLALVVLALLYSVPPVQLSRRPGPDLVANAFGIGVLCTIGGWLVESPGSLPPTVWLLTSLLGTGTFFLLPTLMDLESDLEGGKRTVVVGLGWERACMLGLALISLADVGIVYMSLESIILNPGFLWVAAPIIAGEVIVFPVLARRRELLRGLTATMGGLLFFGNLLIVLSYLDMLGPF